MKAGLCLTYPVRSEILLVQCFQDDDRGVELSLPRAWHRQHGTQDVALQISPTLHTQAIKAAGSGAERQRLMSWEGSGRLQGSRAGCGNG